MIQSVPNYLSGSITPDTQLAPKFDHDSFNKALNLSLEQINKNFDPNTQDLEVIQNMQKRLRNLEESYHIIDRSETPLFQVDYNEHTIKKTPIVKRFGINPNTLRIKSNYYIKPIDLHIIEEINMRKALVHLRDLKDYQEMENSQEYIGNIICLDIFAREEGKIKKDLENIPEVHTVVLWKDKSNHLTLIDPGFIESHFFTI